ncbi:MAG TPA: iron ABC transporter permease [Thermoanaerobaculia bacterium]|nr:iron ABC transporter permease [Thermoanaerobaculia bacterium]
MASTLRAPRNVRVSPFTRISAVAIAAFVSLPLLYLIARAAAAGPEAWRLHLLTWRTVELLGSTLSIAAAVLGVSIAVSLPYAWLVTRTDLPLRRFWAVMGALPLAFPSYIAAFTTVSILGPRGALATAIGRPLPELAYGWSGALIALGLFSYPYLYLLLVAAMKGLDPLLEEAARSLGKTRAAVFTRVVLPQLRPPLAAGALMIVLYTMSDFGAVSIVRYDTFTTAIYDAYRGLFDRTVAALLATVLALLTLIVLAGEWMAVRDFVPGRGRPARPPAAAPLGRWKVPAIFFVSLITFATVAVPLTAIGGWCLRAIRAGTGRFTFAEMGNSLAVSIAAALCCVVLSLPVALWAIRGGERLALIVERLTFTGYALPGIVVALALVVAATRLARPLYQTATLLVAAYVIRFLPEAIAATRSSLASLSPLFEEAARSLGRGRFDVLRRITIPLIRPGLLAGGGLVFLTAMKELPATLILRPTGFETLATRIWSESAVAAWSAAAIPSLLLLLASAVPLWALVIRPVIGKDA